MSAGRGMHAVAAGLTLVLAIGVAALSRAPWRAHPDEAALLRLSLTARPERIETCRTRTAEELAELPAHMRQELVCEGRTARYRLEIEVAGERLAEELLAGGGVRSDRPIHLLREHAMQPGTHRLAVRLTRMEELGESRDVGDGAPRRVETVPAQLVLDTVLSVPPRGVALVGYDPRERRLTVTTP